MCENLDDFRWISTIEEDFDFKWISTIEDDTNTIGMQSPSPSSPSNIFSFLPDFDNTNTIGMQLPLPSSPSNIFSFLPDFVQLPPITPLPSEKEDPLFPHQPFSPITPLPSEEEDPLLYQQLLLYQQTIQQECGITSECQAAPAQNDHAPPPNDQANTGGISKDRASKRDRSEEQRNKHLKIARNRAQTKSNKRRRDRFTEKIKTLQGLLPDCQGRDTAFVLEQAQKHIGLLLYQTQLMKQMKEMQQMIPTQANAQAGMTPYPAMLQYPTAAMLPQLQMQMQMQMQLQMLQYMSQYPQLFPPYSAPFSSMAAIPNAVPPPYPSVPSTDQVTTNVFGGRSAPT